MKSSCAASIERTLNSADGTGTGDGAAGIVGSDSRLGRRVAMVAMAACLLVVSVVHTSLPASPFDLVPPEVKQALLALMPQGWSFFTRSPRIPPAVVYRYEQHGRWRDITEGARTRPADVMGIDRAGRGQGTEIAVLMDQLPDEAWHACEQDPLVCLSASSQTVTVINTSHRSVCGDVGFVVQQVLPWAWRDAPTVMPSQIARAWVKC